jgi:hypothetical protein
MMRMFLACTAIFLSALPARAFESNWQYFESYRILAGACPSEIQAAMRGLPVSELDEAVAIIREREAVFTVKIGAAGDIAQAHSKLDAYRGEMVRQLDEAVKSMGCEKAIQRLRLAIPKPVTGQQVAELARSLPIPTSERNDTIPVADRIGTNAAYPLQKIITLIMIDKKQCDLTTLKATVLKESVKEAKNPPPFVGVLKSFEERWDINCSGNKLSAVVTYSQDARKWRSYKVEMKNEASEKADVATSGGLGRSVD